MRRAVLLGGGGMVTAVLLICALLVGVALTPAAPLTFGSAATNGAWVQAKQFDGQLQSAAGAGAKAAAQAASAVAAIEGWQAPGGFVKVKSALVAWGQAIVAGAPAATLAGDRAAATADLDSLASSAGPQVTNPGSAAQMTALAWAEQEIGVPYVWGGSSPAAGFDCSGLVQWAFARAGVPLPRVAATQMAAGPAVAPGTPLAAGDLVFFWVASDGQAPGVAGHVGIYVGGGWMLDAPHTGVDVRYDKFSSTVAPMPGQAWGTGATYLGATDPGA